MLAGGVGGGRFCDGLEQFIQVEAAQRDHLTIVANVGDDLHWCGLKVCPDFDTILYSMAGKSDLAKGWGVADERWTAFETLRELGGPSWFQMGDRDLGLQLLRAELLSQQKRLSEVSLGLCRSFGLSADILPSCDDPVPTRVQIDSGWISFQSYFVERRHADKIISLEFQGASQARISPELSAAWSRAELILLAPSNPFVSIDPILEIGKTRENLRSFGRPRVAVSPLIGNRAVKGPAADMMMSFGYQCNSIGVAQHYQGLIDGLVIDECDHELVEPLKELGLQVLCCSTLMKDRADRQRLAGQVLPWVRASFGLV